MNSFILTLKKNNLSENLNITALLIAAVLSITMLFKLFSIANVGVDLTDEGYYFNWISNPWLYQYYVSQFGYIYHPIYKAFGNSIIHLRQANIFISFALSWLLSYQVIKQYSDNISFQKLLTISFILATPSVFILMITGRWLPTPSYNSLAFQGCLIAALGVVLSHEKDKQVLSACCIGIGGWLVFMAKPSSALMLMIAVLLYFAPTIKQEWSKLALAGLVATLLLFISALLIDGSVAQFIARFQGGLLFLNIMGGQHGLSNLLRFDLFETSSDFKLILLVSTFFLAVGFIGESAKKTIIQVFLTALQVSLLVITLTYLLNGSIHGRFSSDTILIMLAPIIAALISLPFSKLKQPLTPSIGLIIFFLILPYAFVAGTGNNYWKTAAGAMIIWQLGACLILARRSINLNNLALMVSFTIIASTVIVFNSMNPPYRQSEGIQQQSSLFVDPHTGQQLVMAKDTAKYLNDLTALASSAGFNANTPIVDLTGHHPGALYFIQAKAIGQAWTIGGYQGSQLLAEKALNQASCDDVANAWLLIEKHGRREIFLNIFEGHGIKVNKVSYQNVGQVKSQSLSDWGSRTKLNPNGIYTHYLFRPTQSKHQGQLCKAHRLRHPFTFTE